MKNKLARLFHLTRTQTAKNTYIVFIGNGVAGLLGMVPMILISRQLGPVGFGAFSVAFALFTLMSKLTDLGLNFSLVKNISQSRVKGETKKINRFFWSSFWFKIGLSFLLGGLGFAFARPISVNLFNSPDSLFSNQQVFILIFLFIFYDVLRVYFQANKKFLQSSLMYVLSNLIKLIVVGLVFLFFKDFDNFILIYILTPFLAGIYFLKKTKLKFRFKFYPQEFKQLTGFASWMAISVLFAALGENLNVFMVSASLNEFETGIYSAADKFIIPVLLFTAALSTVLTSRASEFLELEQIKKFIKKIMLLQLVLFFIFLLVLPFAGFIPFILGREYQSSIAVLQILIVANFFRSAITPLNSVFYPLNKPIIFALNSVIQFIGLFSLNQVFIPLYQARGAALSLVVTETFIFFFNYIFLFIQLKKKEKRGVVI